MDDDDDDNLLFSKNVYHNIEVDGRGIDLDERKDKFRKACVRVV